MGFREIKRMVSFSPCRFWAAITFRLCAYCVTLPSTKEKIESLLHEILGASCFCCLLISMDIFVVLFS